MSTKKADRPRTPTKKKVEQDGLIGMFGHTVDADNQIRWQFKIIKRSDDHHVCQLYSFIDGCPTDCTTISRKEILGSCKLYMNEESWNEGFRRYSERQRAREDMKSN